MTLQDLINEFRLQDADRDPFGACMAAWFPVCAEMGLRDMDIPHEWGYRPSPIAGPAHEIDCPWREVLEQADNETLLAFGQRMSRLYDICKKRGWDY